MGELKVVGISDQQFAAPPDRLITYALGSCVGVCLYDSKMRIGGLEHVFMPNAPGTYERKDIYKYADTAIEEMVRVMRGMGCFQGNLTAKIAGGASLFGSDTMRIGDKNVESVKKELRRLNIRIIAEDTGANYGRTVEFNPENGAMTVKTVGKGIKVL